MTSKSLTWIFVIAVAVCCFYYYFQSHDQSLKPSKINPLLNLNTSQSKVGEDCDQNLSTLVQPAAREESQKNSLSQEQMIQQAYTTFQRCFELGDCKKLYDETKDITPKESLIRHLTTIHVMLKDKALSFDVAEPWGRTFIEDPTPAVQLAALQILALSPRSEQNQAAVLKSLKVSVSDQVTMAALDYLATDPDPNVKVEMAHTLKTEIPRAPFTTKTILAKRSRDFMTQENINQFDELLDQLKENSPEHRMLSIAVRDFKQSQVN